MLKLRGSEFKALWDCCETKDKTQFFANPIWIEGYLYFTDTYLLVDIPVDFTPEIESPVNGIYLDLAANLTAKDIRAADEIAIDEKGFYLNGSLKCGWTWSHKSNLNNLHAIMENCEKNLGDAFFANSPLRHRTAIGAANLRKFGNLVNAFKVPAILGISTGAEEISERSVPVFFFKFTPKTMQGHHNFNHIAIRGTIAPVKM